MAYKNANYKTEALKKEEAKPADLINGLKLKGDQRDMAYELKMANRSKARAFVPGLASYDAWNDYNHGYASLGNALFTTGMDALTLLGGAGIAKGLKGPKGVKLYAPVKNAKGAANAKPGTINISEPAPKLLTGRNPRGNANTAQTPDVMPMGTAAGSEALLLPAKTSVYNTLKFKSINSQINRLEKLQSSGKAKTTAATLEHLNNLKAQREALLLGGPASISTSTVKSSRLMAQPVLTSPTAGNLLFQGMSAPVTGGMYGETLPDLYRGIQVRPSSAGALVPMQQGSTALVPFTGALQMREIPLRGKFPWMPAAMIGGSRVGSYIAGFRDPIEGVTGSNLTGVHFNLDMPRPYVGSDNTAYANPAYSAGEATTDFYFNTPQQLQQFLIDNGEDLSAYGTDGRIGRETIYGINHIASGMNDTDRRNFLGQVRKFDTAIAKNAHHLDPNLRSVYNEIARPGVDFEASDQYMTTGNPADRYPYAAVGWGRPILEYGVQ